MSVISGLVLNELLIPESEKITTTITVKRINNTTVGVRVWFELLSTNMESFQRWSLLMNNTDQVLAVAEPDDVLIITYAINEVTDGVAHTFEPFVRNVILDAKFA